MHLLAWYYWKLIHSSMMGFSKPTDWCVLPFQNTQPPRVPWLLLWQQRLIHPPCSLLLPLAPLIPIWPLAQTFIQFITWLVPVHLLNFKPTSGLNWVTLFLSFSIAPLISIWAPSQTVGLTTIGPLIYIMLGFLYAVQSAGNLFLTGSLHGILVGLKMKAFHSSKLLVNFYQGTHYYNPEDCIVTSIRTSNPHTIT